MESEEQIVFNQSLYLALGRFVVCFSHLLNSLEEATVWLFGLGPDGERTILIKAALADRTASPIASAFFSVFFERWGELVTDQDSRIIRCLRKEIEGLIKTRNRIMHDAWMSKTIGGNPGPHSMSLVRVRAHGSGAEYDSVDYGPEDVTNIANDAGRLASVVNAIAWYMKPGQNGPEVAERFEICENKVYIKENT
ncbi:hypothetical protein H6F76_25935 [Leptolyngbya sp. FACHB-321]|uniref:hypothetical protein n=1 Tax=Leptolyngbya sp. FACHB-321 TaxID=2692807 RepID=UPI001683FD0A|nr:hypothetical protein [Leptolyngbya sp. FACHB-321]MBD2038397.1 hypothetical protein [Leptolyngbya sp. FACHB-321]